MTINYVGAECKFRVGIDNVRRLYKINVDYNRRQPIRGNILLIADGEQNPWDSSNCHLDEISMKMHFATSPQEKDYLNKVLKPENPFSADPKDDISYSRDHGCLVSVQNETPRNIFSYVRRTNRTVRNSLMKNTFDIERNNAHALKIARIVDPALYLRVPNIKVPLNQYLMAQLELQKEDLNLTDEEESEYYKAISVLEFGHSTEEIECDYEPLPI